MTLRAKSSKRGEKKHKLCEPFQAEAYAIMWALELAISEHFQNIIVKSNSKICIDALSDDSCNVFWNVVALISNIRGLSSLFNSSFFNWVSREANEVAHTLAKFVSSPISSLYL